MDAETRRRIVDLARADTSSQAIADAVGVDVRTVRRVRRAEGLDAPVGRPATGQRPKIWATVDPEVEAELAAEAERTEATTSAVAGKVLTDWAKRRSARK